MKYYRTIKAENLPVLWRGILKVVLGLGIFSLGFIVPIFFESAVMSVLSALFYSASEVVGACLFVGSSLAGASLLLSGLKELLQSKGHWRAASYEKEGNCYQGNLSETGESKFYLYHGKNKHKQIKGFKSIFHALSLSLVITAISSLPLVLLDVSIGLGMGIYSLFFLPVVYLSVQHFRSTYSDWNVSKSTTEQSEASEQINFLDENENSSSHQEKYYLAQIAQMPAQKSGLSKVTRGAGMVALGVFYAFAFVNAFLVVNIYSGAATVALFISVYATYVLANIVAGYGLKSVFSGLSAILQSKGHWDANSYRPEQDKNVEVKTLYLKRSENEESGASHSDNHNHLENVNHFSH